MPKISLAGFKDPVTRPRFIIWSLVVVLVIAGVMIPVLGVTSTRWFCAESCHKVQDDTITAYQRSAHAEVSCMACHMPVAANPVIFLIHKAEALGELASTVTNNFELPLNPESEVALTMTEDKCTQCHSPSTRKFTPSEGIKIDHKVHAEKSISCTLCHNRTAHVEDFPLTLKNPKSGEPTTKHADFMLMTACFRCHGQEEKAPAPGTCEACHPAGFNLRPPSHEATGAFVARHAEIALEVDKEVKKTLVETGQQTVTGERKAEFAAAERQNGPKGGETLGQMLPPVKAINECGTCHKEAFCLACHGTPMPHSTEFKEPKDPKDPKGHPAVSKAMPDKCLMCHTKEEPNFCNECHHGKQVDYTFDAAQPWVQQHPKAVDKSGLKSCLSKCHAVKFCADCHTANKVFPASHKQPYWTHPQTPTVTKYGSVAASATAVHSVVAQKSTEQCEVCHGPGGVNAPFCAACHKLEMPHTKEFKQFHSKTGRQDPKVCLNCHNWPQLCSNCHHVGASTTVPWLKVHGTSVTQNGAGGCVAKCHKQADCVSCHSARKVVPASHKAPGFIKTPGAELGTHAALYKKDSTVCTYCHAGDAANLPNSAFCKGCHKVDMPHPSGFGMKDPKAAPSVNNAGTHAQLVTTGQATRASCLTCHEAASCNACHHKGSVTDQPWMRYHPTVVKAGGANACFECHKETYCSNCHVNLAKRGLLK
jgi:hypothetical protein